MKTETTETHTEMPATPEREQTAGRQPVGRELVPEEDRATVGRKTVENPKMRCENVDVYYDNGEKKPSTACPWISAAMRSSP